MKRHLPFYFILAALLFSTATAYSQYFEEGTKEYVDEHGSITSRNEAKYYRIAQKDTKYQLAGKAEYYFMDGQLQSRGYYEENARIEKWEQWHRNGQLKETGYYEKTDSMLLYSPVTVYFIENAWDSTGIQLVKEGNGDYYDVHENGKLASKGKYVNGQKQGEWFGYHDDGNKHYIESYDKGKLKEGISYSKIGAAFSYKEVYMHPIPVKGLEGFYRFISKNTTYPKYARRKGIEGKVFIQFVVDKDGSITDVQVLKGIGGGCDEEAARVVRVSPRWTPGKHRGQPIRARMTLPIVFRFR